MCFADLSLVEEIPAAKRETAGVEPYSVAVVIKDEL